MCPTQAPTVAHAANCFSPRATSSARSSCPGLSCWFCRPDNDDFVLRSLVSSCSNVVLCVGVVEDHRESNHIPRVCPDGASGCPDERHG